MADSTPTPNPSSIPQPSRRNIITAGAAAIGATAVAGGAMAGSAGVDPVFAALAELERVEAHVETVRQAHTEAEDLFIEMQPRKDFIYLSDGLSVIPDAIDHEGIDKHFADPGLPEQNIRAVIKKALSWRKKPLTPERQAELEMAR